MLVVENIGNSMCSIDIRVYRNSLIYKIGDFTDFVMTNITKVNGINIFVGT